jgi:hypothetical protein
MVTQPLANAKLDTDAFKANGRIFRSHTALKVWRRKKAFVKRLTRCQRVDAEPRNAKFQLRESVQDFTFGRVVYNMQTTN